VPLDEYKNKYQPSMMKIDVEGFETEVVNGAGSILDKSQSKIDIN